MRAWPALAEYGTDYAFRPSWLVMGLKGTFDPELAGDISRTYLLLVDEEAFTVRIDSGTIDITQAEGDADVAVAMDAATLHEIGAGELTAREAIDSGRAVVEKGDPEEVVAFAGFLKLPSEAAAPA